VAHGPRVRHRLDRVKGVIRSSVTTAVEAVTLSLAAADLTGLTRATSCRSSGDFMGRIRLSAD
jgi:hypothetical protein